MEVEHVSENMIRVVLGSHDLEERGVTMLDLLGNRNQIEAFFYSILEEVDTDHTFTKDQTVTFQVVPKNNGLELLISKTPKNDQNKSSHDENQLLQTLGLADTTDGDVADEIESTNNSSVTKVLVLKFTDFEDFVSLSKILTAESILSTLFKYQGSYYLELTIYVDELHSITMSNLLALIQEYGQLVHKSPEVLAEFGQAVMEHSALELARYYFK